MAKATSRTDGTARKPRARTGPPAAEATRERAATETPADEAPARKRAPRGSSKSAGRGAAKGKTVKRPAKAPGTPASGGKSLVIVESPAKSRTLNKFLGRNFSVMASNGHIMDLPKSELGVDVENEFEPKYVPIRGKTQALAKIKTAARNAERIYLAPDPDREGEAIAWHLAGALESTRIPIRRLTFNEITERAVKAALDQPRDLDMNLVNAQQARRVMDRLVGYKVSPFVWRTVRYGLSAGRVQSVALRLICEREEEIRAFVPEEYWTLEADFETPDLKRFTARLVRVGEEELDQGQLRGEGAGERAQALAAELMAAAARVAGVETTPRQVHPKAPFITSTLQQTAFNRLGFSSQRTMAIAQQLYEGVALGDAGSVGLITYMRTDSPRLAGEAIGEMRSWIGSELGAEYVPQEPRQFRSKKSAQDAHEAIRPSDPARTPESIRAFLDDDQWKLYDLIWKRALASQTASAEYLATTIDVEAGRLGLRASGRVLKFPGFQKLYGVDEEDEAEDSRLPELTEGVTLAVASEPLVAPDVTETGSAGGETASAVRPSQHFTQPPPRYTEGSLVKALEEENIGRPSTYATIVGTITSREYVSRERGRLAPTDLGEAVNRLLTSTFPDIFQVDFTARMEEELDEIEEGKQEWHRVVKDFWDPFSRELEKAEKSKERHRKKVEETTDIACPNCGRMLVKKFGRRGPFLACPGYPECKFTRPVDDAELPVPVEGTCDLCGSALVMRNGPYGRFIACSRRPDCKFTKAVTLGIRCPECGQGELTERRTRRGKTFFGCNRYPDCTFATWDRPRATPCPNCQAPFLIEKETKKEGLTLRCLKCGSKFQPESVGA
ncbi:MAG TPA: type I DNA topoisomerase [Candidatus Eisenbacteria bacterium]|nr:type I DNA topoisomerase [Candidatus Eisenbacteria bacterium]